MEIKHIERGRKNIMNNIKHEERIAFYDKALSAIEPFVKFNVSVSEVSLKYRGRVNQTAMINQLLLICDAAKMKTFEELKKFLLEKKTIIHRKEIKAV